MCEVEGNEKQNNVSVVADWIFDHFLEVLLLPLRHRDERSPVAAQGLELHTSQAEPDCSGVTL